MSKSGLIIAVLAFFILLGTTSLAGAVRDGTYQTTIGHVSVSSGSSSAYLNSAIHNGVNEPGYVRIQNSTNKDNIYTTLNEAYWTGREVTVRVDQNQIVDVWTL